MRTPPESRSLAVVFGALLLGGSLLGPARAQAGDVPTAEELFRRGKERLSARDYAEACPLLAESYRLDPATGSLLALALCHQREGKLATALDEYRDAAVRARAQRRRDRERAALKEVARLEGKVSTLTIDASQNAELGTLEVRVNGSLLDPAQLDRAQPMDGGSVLLEASAPDRLLWRTNIALAASGDAQKVVIPALEPLPPPPEPVVATRAEHRAPEPKLTPAAVARHADDSAQLSSLQWTGIGLLSGAAVGLSVGLGFTVRAIRKDDDSEAGCVDDLCTAAARADRTAARNAGNAATGAIAAGLALGTAGLVTYLVGRRRAAPDRSARRAVGAAAWAAPQGSGAAVAGSF